MPRTTPLAIPDAPQRANPAGQVGNAGTLLDAALEALASHKYPIEDRAMIYAALYAMRRKVSAAMAPVRLELAHHLANHGIRRLGPIAAASESYGVAWPCNDPGNWADAGVQDALRDLAGRSDTAPYVRSVPAHFEIDTAAIGEGYGRGDPAAIRLHRTLSARGWRTAEGSKPSIRVALP
jgi:hypothetical protein